MRVVTAPEPWFSKLREKVVFMAGSIEMGKAEPWQDRLIEELKQEENLVLLNPRRACWDESWEQTTQNEEFVEQVDWELRGIERATHVIFYFDPKTYSPITLMELGYIIGINMNYDRKIIVCCPEGFYRKGNVDILCQRNAIKVVETLNEVVDFIRLS